MYLLRKIHFFLKFQFQLHWWRHWRLSRKLKRLMVADVRKQTKKGCEVHVKKQQSFLNVCTPTQGDDSQENTCHGIYRVILQLPGGTMGSVFILSLHWAISVRNYGTLTVLKKQQWTCLQETLSPSIKYACDTNVLNLIQEFTVSDTAETFYSRAHVPTQRSVATAHMQEKPSFLATSYNHPESPWGVKCIEHKQDF